VNKRQTRTLTEIKEELKRVVALPTPPADLKGPTPEEIEGGVDLTEYLVQKAVNLREQEREWVKKTYHPGGVMWDEDQRDRARREYRGRFPHESERERKWYETLPHKSNRRHSDHLHADLTARFPSKDQWDRMMAIFKSPGDLNGLSIDGGRKVITDIQHEWGTDDVDVTSITDPVRKYVPGNKWHSWNDQDGVPLPKPLERRLEAEASSGTLSDERAVEILNQWNNSTVDWDKTVEDGRKGHRSTCLYDGSHTWACTCQEQWVLGAQTPNFRWLCVCCEQARATTQYSLCALCMGHQDSTASTVDLEHQLRDADEAELRHA
jgi:hypothetical protein